MATYPPRSAVEVMEFLLAGNQRFLAGKSQDARLNLERRQAVVEAQHPFAVVLCCSDSRVPPEIIFSKRIGDLFVVRNAGNVLGDVTLGSIEYAVEHLGVPLVLVLGHEKCGAVTAAVKGGEAPGHVNSVVQKIRPVVEKVQGLPGDPVANAVDANILEVVAQLKASAPTLAPRIQSDQLTILGYRYNLGTGTVTRVAD